MSGGAASAAFPLSLADGLLPACETLASAVAAGFGPSFKSTLVVSSTGKLLMTNSGLRIMRSLDVDHPCARLVVECARRHHDLTGDNAKSFAVLLTELLRLIAADSASAGPPQQQQRRQQQLAAELGRALADDDVLPALLRRLRDRAVTRVEGNDPVGFRDALLDVIRGSLGCHLLEYDVLSLSALVRDYILGWAAAAVGEFPADDGVGRRRLPAILDLVLRHFDVLCVPCGSKPAVSSRIVDGLLLSRCCHYAPRPRRRPQLAATNAEDEGCCSSGPEEDDSGGSDNVPTRFLVMSCGLEAGDGSDDGDSDDDAGVDGTARATLALRAALIDSGGGGESESVAAAAAAAAAGVLLKAFSTRSDRVAHFLAQCARAGVTLLVTTRTLSELERRLCHEYGIDYVHALPADEAQLLATIAGAPVVHDAAECLLRGRLPPTAIGHARNCVQLQFSAGGAATYTNLVGVRSAACGARTLVACGPTDGLCQQLRDCVRDALRCVRSAITSSSGGYLPAEAGDADKSVASGGGDDELMLCAFPVGGAFEIALHQLISERLAQQHSSAGVAAAEALRLLADALLCVPRMLHANAYSFSKPRWPATLQDLKASCLASGGGDDGPEGVHASTGASSRLSALQPLRSKELLVLHVVSLTRQLLRTDYVLPASAAAVLPKTMTASGIR